MKKNLKGLGVLATSILSIAAVVSLASCGSGKPTIMIWGPADHETIYLEAAKEYATANSWDVDFAYGSSGDAGAYSAMSIDPQAGAEVYTFANDMLSNLNRIGALSKVTGDNLSWIKANNVEASTEAGKIGDGYYAYPVTADNGYYMYFNKSAFEGTSIWDSKTNSLKDGYTLRDMYAALDEKGGDWANSYVTWGIGDSWYDSGVFFATGGDYKVTYDEKGSQTDAKCWFGYQTAADGTQDYTIGLEAAQSMKNTFLNVDGSANKHFIYSDATSGTHLNDNITKYLKDKEHPLAAAISGTWKSVEIKSAWGDNASATFLPTLEGRTTAQGGANKEYQMKTFCGFKMMGVNPYSKSAQGDSTGDNLTKLHAFAKYLTDTDFQIKRYQSTGAGPSNLAAQKSDAVKNDYALIGLNAQYAKGYRVQDSVPSNYWTPIQKFGAGLYNDMTQGVKGTYDTEAALKRALKQLQYDIESASK